MLAQLLAGKWGQITISDFIRHMGADLPAIKRSWRSVVLSRASPLVLRCLRLFANCHDPCGSPWMMEDTGGVFCRGMDLRCRIERSAHRRSCAH